MDLLIAAAELDGALGKPSQESLLIAREMQAMSFIFHIPLVCFGIAFPAMVLYMERMWLRTGDPTYKAIAKRWSKVMLILFAVGVVTGTILSFEFGLLWPNVTATFGEVTDVRPWEALFNSHLWFEITHMYLAGFLVAGFIVAGVYAYGWLKGRRSRYVRAAMIVPLTFACLIAPVQLVVGDWAARTIAKDQPLKLAAFEGLNETEKGAPFTIGGIYIDGELKYGISIPYLLSILADHNPDGVVQGLDIVPERDRPPVNPVHLGFQAMVFIGTGLALLTVIYLYTWFRKRRLPRGRWFYRALVAAGPLAVVALISGWITTEVGRQPWVVYETMRTEDAVTDAGGLPIAFGVAALVYLALVGGVVWLLRRLASRPAHTEIPEAVDH